MADLVTKGSTIQIPAGSIVNTIYRREYWLEEYYVEILKTYSPVRNKSYKLYNIDRDLKKIGKKLLLERPNAPIDLTKVLREYIEQIC